VTLRQRFFLVASILYVVIGLLIVARGVISHVPVAGIFGVVLVGLGLVRIRDFSNWRRRPGDP
jgi:uncharacterized membrane protein HdeD (DUF308 family)